MTNPSSTTIQLTGANAQYTLTKTCKVTFLGIENDSCTIENTDQVTATFTKGVPPTDSEAYPELRISETVGSDTVQ